MADSATRQDHPPLAVHEIDWNADVSDDALLAFVDSHYRSGKLRRQQWEGKAATYLEWAAGNQWVEWDYELADLKNVDILQPEDLPMEARLPVSLNTIKGQVLHKIALLVSQGITWRARPLTGKDEDRRAARIGNKLLQWQWFQGDEPMQGLRIIGALWNMFCTGVTFGKVVWDPDLGDSDVFDASRGADEKERKGVIERTMETLKTLLGGNVPADVLDRDGRMKLPEGQVVTRIREGCDITEPQFATDVDACRWLIDSEWVTIEQLREEFGQEKTKDIQPGSSTEAMIAGYRGLYGVAPEENPETLEPNTLVLKHELWRPRLRSCREGFLGVVANGHVLRNGTHPYKHGKLPYFRMIEIPDRRRFRPMSTVANLLGVQKARNTIRSACNAYTMMLVNPKLLFEKSAKLPQEAMSWGPRATEVADDALQGGKITPINWAPIPQDAFRMDRLFAEDMQDIGQVHDATMGKRSDSKESGKHAELLITSDARGNSIVRVLMQESLARGGVLSLHLWHQFVSESRAISLTGARAEVMTFKGSDLRGSREAGKLRFNVEVEIGEERDTNRALEEIRVLSETGFFSPENPADQARVRRLLGDSLVREGDTDSQERNAARDENEALLDGKDVATTLGDFDQQHIEEHEALTTTSRYRQAVQGSPEIAQKVSLHVMEHRYQMAQKRYRQAALDKIVEVAESKIVQEQLAELGLLPEGAGSGAPRRVNGSPARPMPGGQPGAPPAMPEAAAPNMM
jgi:hypothetical protein